MEKYFYSEAKQARRFLEEERAVGCGPLSIGTQLEISEDIYSLMVVSQFKREIVDQHRWKIKVNEDADEANLNLYKQENPDAVKFPGQEEKEPAI